MTDLGGQGVTLDPADADDLADLLLQAAAVIHVLAGDPGAEAAAAQAVTGEAGSCQDLAIRLQLAAAELEEQAAIWPPAPPGKHPQNTTPANAAGKRPRHAAENQHSEEAF